MSIILDNLVVKKRRGLNVNTVDLGRVTLTGGNAFPVETFDTLYGIASPYSIFAEVMNIPKPLWCSSIRLETSSLKRMGRSGLGRLIIREWTDTALGTTELWHYSAGDGVTQLWSKDLATVVETTLENVTVYIEGEGVLDFLIRCVYNRS